MNELLGSRIRALRTTRNFTQENRLLIKLESVDKSMLVLKVEQIILH